MANSAVFGIFSTKQHVETAVDQMRREGFRYADISVLFHNERTKDFAGGALGSLYGVGVLANPGLGRLIAARPMMALLSDASAGIPIGGLTGALTSADTPEHMAGRYAERIKGGCILLSVQADDFKWIRKARQIFKQTRADDITSTGETKGNYASTDKRTDRASVQSVRKNNVAECR